MSTARLISSKNLTISDYLKSIAQQTPIRNFIYIDLCFKDRQQVHLKEVPTFSKMAPNPQKVEPTVRPKKAQVLNQQVCTTHSTSNIYKRL